MRPHIEPREAQFILELLTASQAIHNSLEVYYLELDKEVNRLEKLKITYPFEALKQGLTTKKTELAQWEKLRWGLGWTVHINQPITRTLILKYQNIAEGKKHRGVYKHLNNVLAIQNCIRDVGSVKEVLEKELQPIETLGVKAE